MDGSSPGREGSLEPSDSSNVGTTATIVHHHQPVIGNQHLETSATRYYLPIPDDEVGLPGSTTTTSSGRVVGGNAGGRVKSNVFFSHFDVEDVGEAYTLTNWLPLDDVPKVPDDPDALVATAGGLHTPEWVETAYNTLYCARVPNNNGEGATPWKAQKFLSPGVGVGFQKGNPLKEGEIRTLEATIGYVARLRPRTQEDARPLIELMAALLQHLVIEVQSTYWSLSRHFESLKRDMMIDFERRVAEADQELREAASIENSNANKKSKMKDILLKMTRGAMHATVENAARLMKKMAETQAAGKSMAEQMQKQKTELAQLRAMNKKNKATMDALAEAGFNVNDMAALQKQLKEVKKTKEAFEQLKIDSKLQAEEAAEAAVKAAAASQKTTLKKTLREKYEPLQQCADRVAGGGTTAAMSLMTSNAQVEEIKGYLMELPYKEAGECFKMLATDAGESGEKFDTLRKVLMGMPEIDAARVLEATGNHLIAARYIAALPTVMGGYFLMQTSVGFGSAVLSEKIPDDAFHMENASSIEYFFDKYKHALRFTKPKFEEIWNLPVMSHLQLQEEAALAIKRMGFWNDALLDTVVYYCQRQDSKDLNLRLFAGHHMDMYTPELIDGLTEDGEPLPEGKDLFEAERDGKPKSGPFSQIAAEGWELTGDLIAIPVAQVPLDTSVEDDAEYMKNAVEIQEKFVPEPGCAWGVVAGPARSGMYANVGSAAENDPEMLDILNKFARSLATAVGSLNRQLELEAKRKKKQKLSGGGAFSVKGGIDMEKAPTGPPPKIIPLMVDVGTDRGVVKVGDKEMSWNVLSWEHATKIVHAIVLDQNDPRLVLRHTHLYDPDFQGLDDLITEEFTEMMENEIALIQCGDWQPRQMTKSKVIINELFKSETVVSNPSNVDKTVKNVAGDGFSIVVGAGKGAPFAAETFGSTWKGWAVLDPNDGLFHVIDENHSLATLEIFDVLSEVSSDSTEQQQEEMALQMLLTKHNTDIWRIFQHYCVLAASLENDPFAISISQFKTFVKEAFVGVENAKDNNLIDRVFALVNSLMHSLDNKKASLRMTTSVIAPSVKDLAGSEEAPAAGGKEVSKVNNRSLDIDEFKEALIRFCLIFFGGWGNKPKHQSDTANASKAKTGGKGDKFEGSLYALGPVRGTDGKPLPILSPSEALAEGLHKYVLKNAGRLALDDNFVSRFTSKDVKNTMRKFKSLLSQAFKHATFTNSSGRLDHNNWIVFCRKVQLLGTKLSMTALSKMFLEIVDKEAKGDLTVGRQLEAAQLLSAYKVTGENGMNYEDFCQGVARCADIVYGKPGATDSASLVEVIEQAVNQNVDRNMSKVEEMKSKGGDNKKKQKNRPRGGGGGGGGGGGATTTKNK